ncbi:Uu.00g118090.m01.CDS01 [Anthostomella pinea]|uniref:Uu.00g118090.m01.CDS01 n=1 Tax=Anthostomella pinea TaxID=933095 RepID=A0AAI8VGD3_9PEZI|nr:Uu.00g118090.m01.CDS01 [Anthostomella pinea]
MASESAETHSETEEEEEASESDDTGSKAEEETHSEANEVTPRKAELDFSATDREATEDDLDQLIEESSMRADLASRTTGSTPRSGGTLSQPNRDSANVLPPSRENPWLVLN